LWWNGDKSRSQVISPSFGLFAKPQKTLFSLRHYLALRPLVPKLGYTVAHLSLRTQGVRVPAHKEYQGEALLASTGRNATPAFFFPNQPSSLAFYSACFFSLAPLNHVSTTTSNISSFRSSNHPSKCHRHAGSVQICRYPPCRVTVIHRAIREIILQPPRSRRRGGCCDTLPCAFH